MAEVVTVKGEELQVLSDLVAAPITGQTWLRQANAFTEAGYKISIYGKRILWLCLSEVKGDESHPGVFTVTAQDYFNAFGKDRSSAAKDFKRGIESLLKSGGVKFRLSPGKYEGEYLPWFKRVGFLKEGTAEASYFLEFNPLLWRRIVEVGDCFTRLDFVEVDPITSAKQANLYELCRQNAYRGGFEILLEDLVMGCGLNKSEASNAAELKRRFLEPAKATFKEINSPLKINYTKTKDGYKFTIFDTAKMEKANTDGLPVEPVEETEEDAA